MDSTEPNARISDKFIRNFEWRARFLRATAAVILLIVVVLLGLGAYVFIDASSIATRDIEAGTDYLRTLEESRAALGEEAAELEERSERYLKQFEVAQRELIDLAQAETDLSDVQLRLNIVEHRLSRYRQKREGPPKVQFANAEEVRIAIENKKQLVGALSFIRQAIVERIRAGGGSRTDKMIAEHSLARAKGQLRELIRHEKELAAREAKEDPSLIDLIVGRSGGDAAQAPSTATHLIQTNVTRFGTLLVVFFFIALLQPIFRYNTRLAAFYDARADALLLFRASAGRDIETLVSMLTPTLAFDKDEERLEDKSMEVVKEMIKTVAKEDRK